MKRKTVLNILLILLVLSFFVTPIGYHGKVFLNKVFSFSPKVTPPLKRDTIKDYGWKLKDAKWDLINFDRSEGKVIFINFWASWRLPCAAELQSIQELYDRYKGQVDFYLITNEERAPVETFMQENGFDFPVTYLIIGEKAPVETDDPPRSYLIDKKGAVVIAKQGIADWDTTKIYHLLDRLIQEK